MDYDDFNPHNWTFYDSELGLEEEVSFLNRLFQTFILISYAFICVIGLAGNSLVVFAVFQVPKLQTVTHQFIGNVAIANLIFLSALPFLITTAELGHWIFGRGICKAYISMTSVNQITISFFLLMMTVDRYLVVCHPTKAPKLRTQIISQFVMISVWIITVVLIVPIAKYGEILEIADRINCNIFWPESETMSGELIFIWYSFVIGFAAPVSLTLVFYIITFLHFSTVGTQNQNSFTKEQREITKLVLSLVTVHFACWIPYWTCQMFLVVMLDHHGETFLVLFILAGILSYSYSATFPIMCFFLSESFNKNVREACFCCKKAKRNISLGSDTAEMNLISVTKI